jgi:hypothetical protein
MALVHFVLAETLDNREDSWVRVEAQGDIESFGKGVDAVLWYPESYFHNHYQVESKEVGSCSRLMHMGFDISARNTKNLHESDHANRSQDRPDFH